MPRLSTAAYCCQSFTHSVRLAAATEPLTCPPLAVDNVPLHALTGHNLLYIKLHGLPGQPYWYGDDWITALSASQIRSLDLAGSIVFCAVCHLEGSPMLDALLAAGAIVIGGKGINYARPRSVYGTDALGRTFRRALQLGLPCSAALATARLAMRAVARRDPMVADALAFRMFRP